MDEYFEVVDEGTNKHGVDVQVRLNTRCDRYLPCSNSPTIPEDCEGKIKAYRDEWEELCEVGAESADDLHDGWVFWQSHETRQSAREAAADIEQDQALNRWFRRWRAKYAHYVEKTTREALLD